MKHALATVLLLLLVPGCVRRIQDVRVARPGHGESTPGVRVTEDGAATPLSAALASIDPPTLPTAPREPAARYRIDWDFIRSVEGRPRSRGYVPSSRRTGQPIGRSGVTIATGFDLGQHDAADLDRLGLDPSLIAVLQPYLRRRGTSAQAVLRRQPLTLSPREVQAIDMAKFVDTARKVERRFDASRASYVPRFVGLSPAQQTVIFSLAIQYGTRLDRKTPAFWNHVVNGRFDRAVGELRHFGDGYGSRRNREADLLVEEWMRWAENELDLPRP